MSRKRSSAGRRPVPAVAVIPGQLEMFAVGRTRVRPVGCESPDTCTNHDPCPQCGRSITDPERTDR